MAGSFAYVINVAAIPDICCQVFGYSSVVRADRLVSLMLLLRQRGRMSAAALARELEVSPRTVLRDIEALSAAGVPVYAERGRHGGFALLPGFRAELGGLNSDEALALLSAGSGAGSQMFGLGSALASAVRKIVDSLPERHRATAGVAAQRILVDPETDLLSRSVSGEDVPAPVMDAVRRAVLTGRRLRLHYEAGNRTRRWDITDPIGLVTVRDKGYLLARTDGADRTYRLARILAAEVLPDPAQRPDTVDLDQLWRERSTQFRTGGDQLLVRLRMRPARWDELVATALAVVADQPDTDGWLQLDVAFQDLRHAVWALWELGVDAEAITPQVLRATLRDRATAIVERYDDQPRPSTR